MMIGFSTYYCKRSVDLFGKYSTDHLVGECHFGEGNLGIRSLIDLLGKSIRPAYYKNHVTGGVVQPFL